MITKHCSIKKTNNFEKNNKQFKISYGLIQ